MRGERCQERRGDGNAKRGEEMGMPREALAFLNKVLKKIFLREQ